MIYTGQKAVDKADTLALSRPIENGIVRNWNEMEVLLKETFHPTEQNAVFRVRNNNLQNKVILTEAPLNPTKNREKLCEIMFEKINVDAVHVSTQAVLSLYARGLMTGVVVDVGDGVSHIVPVYQGAILSHLTKRLNIAGRDITRQLSKLLFLQGYSLSIDNDYNDLQNIKENLCYVSLDLDVERKLAAQTTVQLKEFKTSRGKNIKLTSERFMAPEVLFKPYLMDKEEDGLAESTFKVINSADIDLRADFYKSIILSGGTTLFKGFPTRLSKDLKNIYQEKILKGVESNKIKIQVDKNPDRKYTVFTGASVLAEIMQNQDDFWIWKSEWQENGSAAAISRLAKMKI